MYKIHIPPCKQHASSWSAPASPGTGRTRGSARAPWCGPSSSGSPPCRCRAPPVFCFVFFRRMAGSGVSQSESIPLGNQSGGHVGGQQAGGKQAKTRSERIRRRQRGEHKIKDQGTVVRCVAKTTCTVSDDKTGQPETETQDKIVALNGIHIPETAGAGDRVAYDEFPSNAQTIRMYVLLLLYQPRKKVCHELDYYIIPA